MIIGLTSKNELKLDSVKKAYGHLSHLDVRGYSAASLVGEQPVGEQTLAGARNRILDVRSRITGLDRIVSIENGIFFEENEWRDKAVVVIYDTVAETEHVGFSEYVVFPTKYVAQARAVGFDTMTVGQVMVESGYVKNQKDPLLCISGISRQTYLENALRDLVEIVES